MTLVKQQKKKGFRIRFQQNQNYLIALTLITLSSFGNNYAFNNPQALHQPLKQKLNINESQFQLLYSIFAFPNILGALFIGYLIDFFEIYKGFVVLVLAVAFFQSIVAVGAYMENYKIILIGRLFFGVSSQSLISAQAALVSCLFKRKRLALALGVVITFPEIGNALNSLISFHIYELFGQSIGAPFLVSVLLCIFCSLFALLAVRFIKLINKTEQEHQRQLLFSQNNLINQLLESSSQSSQASSEIAKQTIHLKDLKQLTYPFWLVTLLCTIFLGLYIAFLDGANGLLTQRFLFNGQTAGKMIMLTYISSAFFSIPSGLIIDKIGQRRFITIFLAALLLMVQLILYFSTHQTNIFFIALAFMFLGMGFAIYSNCVLASVSLIVNKKIIGTAFGIVQMLQSVGLCVIPIISGALIDNKHETEEGYLDSQIFFICIGLFGLIISFGLICIPKYQKMKLDAGKKNNLKQKLKKTAILTEQDKKSDTYSVSTDQSLEYSLNKSLLSTKSAYKQPKQIQIQNLINIYLPLTQASKK